MVLLEGATFVCPDLSTEIFYVFNKQGPRLVDKN